MDKEKLISYIERNLEIKRDITLLPHEAKYVLELLKNSELDKSKMEGVKKGEVIWQDTLMQIN